MRVEVIRASKGKSVNAGCLPDARHDTRALPVSPLGEQAEVSAPPDRHNE